MIIFLTKDMITQKRYPYCFGLINNKSEAGYIEFFKCLKNIITIENTKNLKLISYTTDFEQSLLNALKIVFPKIKAIGCFYHYTRNIKEKLKIMNLNKEEFKKENEDLLNVLFRLPFIYYKNKNIIDNIFDNTNIKYESFKIILPMNFFIPL